MAALGKFYAFLYFMSLLLLAKLLSEKLTHNPSTTTDRAHASRCSSPTLILNTIKPTEGSDGRKFRKEENHYGRGRRIIAIKSNLIVEKKNHSSFSFAFYLQLTVQNKVATTIVLTA